MKSINSVRFLPTPEEGLHQLEAPANHDNPNELVITVRTDLDDLTYRTFIEPADDLLMHVYSAPRDKMVETGDIVFRRTSGQEAKFFDVVYASTLRYPATPCAKACSRLPYQVFLQLEQIFDPSRVHDLLTDLAEQDALPF